VQAQLRCAGFFVRSSDLLDRLGGVRKLVFDETGTLTLGRLELADEAALLALDDDARDIAYNLACRSPFNTETAVRGLAIEGRHWQRAAEGTSQRTLSM
jgi:Cu2+-exporting ATPase